VYLLSCASEHTLLITHISTGRNQFVPRLGSEMVGLSLSNSGSKYALSMANNNIKILDAANSELVSEIAGTMLPSAARLKASTPKSYSKPIAVLQPSSDRLYITGVEGSGGTVQAYDLLHDQQSLRFDVAPTSGLQTSGVDQRPVYQVNTRLAAFSHDGCWFATSDEWDGHGSLEECAVAETNLKFWRLKGREWVMTTKVESPHGRLCRVLDLASPVSSDATLEFATLGDDSEVKVWRSFGELRSSPTWGLFRTIGSSPSSQLSEGSIFYSADGTILFAKIGTGIYMINQSNGNVLKYVDVGQSISNIDILDRYILSLQSEPPVLSCLDIATGHVLFSERFDLTISALAVNRPLSSFAISTSSARSKSMITVSRILRGKRIDEAQIHLNSPVAVLLGANLSFVSGFIYVDKFGQVGCITVRPSKAPRRIDWSDRRNIAPTNAVSRLAKVEKRGNSPKQESGGSVNGILGVLEREGDINVAKTLEEIIQYI
jgi:hypothetical protein